MELLTMNRIELDRLAALRRYAGSLLTQADLARHLGLSERQVRRLLRRLEAEGEAGLVSRRRGKTSNNRLDPALLGEALTLVRERYPDFGPTFANEKLREVHGLMLSTESLRKAMLGAGLWTTGKSHRPVRLHLPRPRRPCRGELVQVDGSHHDWFETRGPRCVLMNAVDDATSTMVAGYFAPTESTEAYFALLDRLIRTHGRPGALYSDRHASLTPTRQSIHDERVSQVGRALDELDIELICATSPQAKGRVERSHQTLQHRLVRELRLREISTIDAANLFLPDFIEDYNARFGVEPICADSAFRPLETALEHILIKRFQRLVRKDLTFQVGRQLYQITDVVSAARLRGASIDIHFDHETMIVQRRGQRLSFKALDLRPDQGAIVAAPDLDAHLTANAKQHQPRKPSPNHPWRRPFLTSPPPKQPDIST